MNCCGSPQCQGIEQIFDPGRAQGEVERYRKKGPSRETQLLLDALRAEGLSGSTLLDVGGGIGVIQLELLRDGVSSAVHVDGSSAYLAAAAHEADRLGLAGRVERHHGDFVRVAAQLHPADVVTLDRVLCCYDDMPALVRAATGQAQRLVGLVFPRENVWMRLGTWLLNLGVRLEGSRFRSFVHATRAVDALLREGGFACRYHRKTLFWQVMVYVREAPTSAG